MGDEPRATIADLYRVKAKAELVNGKIVLLEPAGDLPGTAADRIFLSLREYVLLYKRGRAVSGNAAFCVQLPHRESFCPDAAYDEGPSPGMKFFERPPRFAVEVRNVR